MKPTLIKILTITGVALIVAACKTSQTATQPTLPGTTPTEVIHELTPSDLVQRLQKEQPAFHTANASKMSVYVDFKGRQMDVKASLKLVSDSALHLSIQPFFGVELFKLEMTPASMIVIDKMNKMFYESNYSIFRNTLGVSVNYDGIQSLISNRLFVPGEKVFPPDRFSWKDSIPGNTLAHQNETFSQDVLVDMTLTRIAEILIKSAGNTLKTGYSDFKKVDGMVFPQKIIIDGNKGETVSSFHFTIEEVQFNKPLVMEPTNLSRYTRGNINSFFRK